MSDSGQAQHRLFVYGLLLRRETGHEHMEGARFECSAVTKPVYELVNMGRYPALLTGGNASVRGEVYWVDDTMLQRLDEYEECPELYQRRWVTLEDGTSAMAYVLPRERAPDLPTIAGGDWRRRNP